MATPMEMEGYRLSKDSPLRATDPSTIHPTRFPTHVNLAPCPFEPGPQNAQPDGFPAEQAQRFPGQITGGFSQGSHTGETGGAKHQITQKMSGADPAAALAVGDSPNWLGGHVLPPAVPNWEVQPEMATDKKSMAPSPSMTVSPTSSSY